MNDIHRIWNRACGAEVMPGFRVGDRHLTTALILDGYVQNGGLLNAVESLEGEEVSRAVAGLRYFGLQGYADVTERTLAALPLDDDDLVAAEELEQRADASLGSLVGDSSDALTQALTTAVLRSPGDFAPKSVN